MTRATGRAATLAAAGTQLSWWWLRRHPLGAPERWTRPNFRDRPVSLLLGPSVVVGASLGAASAPGGLPAAGLALGAGAIGLYDDLAGDRHARGLRGHLRALRTGRVTTGLIKLAALSALAGAAAAARRRSADDWLIDTVVIAGAANLVNLFDLRPGRAGKVVMLASLATSLAGSTTAAAPGVAAAAALRVDLGEAGMLGDCGASALGIMIGWALTDTDARWSRLATAAGIVALTLVSEQVSFSAVIYRHGWLRALDQWGRAA